MDPIRRAWDELDVSAPPVFRFVAGERGRLAVLLGAFDPPTNAHVDIVLAAARDIDARPAFCLTKVLLDRPDRGVLPPAVRLRLLVEVGAEHDIGCAVANRGTYVDVATAAAEAGCDATFVIGSDKLAQLEDPRFYADGRRGVERTFADVRFVVVPRGDAPIERDVRVLHEAFDEPGRADISATAVRRRLADGRPIGHLVPGVVARALRGYTGATERG